MSDPNLPEHPRVEDQAALHADQEFETGLGNVIVRPDVYERYRRAIRTSSTLIIEGRLQKESGCVDVVERRRKRRHEFASQLALLREALAADCNTDARAAQCPRQASHGPNRHDQEL